MTPCLALDLGTKCGHVLRDSAGQYHGGTADFSAPTERVGLRYRYFREFLLRLWKSSKFEVVIYERVMFMPRAGGLKAAQTWAGLEAVLTSLCEYREIEYIGVPATTLKKDFTGSGRAKKDDMIHQARKLGWKPQDDNHADAIALMQFYEAHHERRDRRVAPHEKVSLQEQALDL